jgi:hypothetical protein
MASNDVQERWGRETRLLVLIVVVSLAVLLILARFRFPSANLDVAPPAPSPLANLAGRAAFQDLADTMVTLFGRVSPRVAVVRLETTLEVPAPAARGARPEPPAQPVYVAFAAALRVRPDLAVVHVPSGMHVASLLGSAAPAEVVAADAARELALVRIPLADDLRSDTATEGFSGFAYVGVVGATASGPGIEPLFVGRTGVVPDPRWPAGLIALSQTGPADGSLLFAIDGRLVGLVVRGPEGTPAVVPSSVIEVVVGEMAPMPAATPPVEGGS